VKNFALFTPKISEEDNSGYVNIKNQFSFFSLKNQFYYLTQWNWFCQRRKKLTHAQYPHAQYPLGQLTNLAW
jgi:hypothetical protein